MTFFEEILTLKEIHMKLFDVVVTVLLIIGGLNWGLVGIFEFDLVQNIFGQGAFAQIIYTVVGLSAICKVIFWNMGETAE
jgi:uncharacterized membrane protein YuzA (DUF378 family)